MVVGAPQLSSETPVVACGPALAAQPLRVPLGREGRAMENTRSPYMPQAVAAEFLGLSPKTLERFRVEGRGPSFLKLGRRVMYSRDDLVKWAESQRRMSTSDPGEPVEARPMGRTVTRA